MSRRTRLNLEPLEGRSLLSGLAANLATDQSTYSPGEPIVMTFRETNDTGHAIAVDDGPSVDGFIVDRGGTEVWRSNAGLNPMYIRVVTLQPGQSLTLTATWDGIPTGGTTPVSGQFEISNQLDPKAASATVTISDSTSPPSTPPTPSPPSSPGPTPVSPPSGSGSLPVALSVTTNQSTYRRGHPVRMTVTLHDVSHTPVDLRPDAAVVGFTVLDGSTEVWHAARNVPARLKPGHSFRLSAAWSGRLAATAVPGTYTIQAVEGNDSASSTFQITA